MTRSVRVGRPSDATVLARATAAAIARDLGAAVAAARRRRGWTQAHLARLVGVGRSTIGRLETGRGAGASLATWARLASVLGLPLTCSFGRDPADGPVDAGHLDLQELLLALGRGLGWRGTVESPVGRGPSGWIDVLQRDDAHRRLIVEEAWNTLGDLGSAIRTFERKLALAAEHAVAIGGDRPYAVHGVWVLRASRRNRELLERYPSIFAARFAGSSAGWVAALVDGAVPPSEPGLVWAEPRAGRLHAHRQARLGSAGAVPASGAAGAAGAAGVAGRARGSRSAAMLTR